MDGQTNTQNLSVEQATFSGQLQNQASSATASVDNTEIARLHRRNRFYQALWIAAGIILLLLFTTAAILIWRNRSQVSQLTNPTDRYKPVNLNLSGQTLQPGLQGVLAVNGDITATGTVSAANLQGSGSGITNLQATNIVGSLQPGQLDPFIAYTNKNFQVFFGTNQLFRNSTNSVGAFEVQNASSAPVLSVNTATSTVTVNESVATQSGLAFEVSGNGRFAGSLQVGPQSDPNTSILDTGPLFSNDVQRTLTVQVISTDNSAADRVFAGTSAELLADPQYSPVTLGTFFGFDIVTGGNKNVYTGGYSAMQTRDTNTEDFYLNGGSMSAFTHAGTGTVLVGAGQFNTIANLGGTPTTPGGDISYAFGNAVTPVTNNGVGNMNGIIKYYAGFSALDPQSATLTSLGFPLLVETGTIERQVGLQVMQQHSGSINSANIVSEGYTSKNYFEGKILLGRCADNITPSSALGTALCFTPPPGGNKLVVNPQTTFFDDTSASVLIHTATTSDTGLTIQGKSGQTADLTVWRDSTGLGGATLSRVSANGSFNIGSGAPTNRLSVVDTTDDTPANFTGASGTCTVDTLGGGWSCVSDENLKANILSIDGGLDKIMALRGVTYNWKNDENQKAVSGFIAQEVEKILPGLVSSLPDGTKTLNKDGILPYLVSAIQDQQKQIDTIKNPSGGVSVDVLKTMADSKAVEFGGDVTVNGNVIIKGALVGSANSRGTVVIPAGQKTGGYSFGNAYSKTPNIVVSPSADTGGRYWLKSKSASGFTVELESAQTVDVRFDWQAQE